MISSEKISCEVDQLHVAPRSQSSGTTFDIYIVEYLGEFLEDFYLNHVYFVVTKNFPIANELKSVM